MLIEMIEAAVKRMHTTRVKLLARIEFVSVIAFVGIADIVGVAGADRCAACSFFDTEFSIAILRPTLPLTIAATTINANMINIHVFLRRNSKIVFGVGVEGHFSLQGVCLGLW
jgi:hypothetical protein